MNMSLGDRLKARLDREEADKLEKLRRQAREKDAEAQRKLQVIEAFFNQAQDAISEDILADRSVRRIVLGKRQHGEVCDILATYNWNDPARIIDRPTHMYYPVWEKFAQWANQNGLRVGWDYEHDGVGIESWHVLSVKPIGSALRSR